MYKLLIIAVFSLVLCVSCNNKGGISTRDLPEKIQGGWLYEEEKILFSDSNGRADSVLLNNTTRPVMTQIELGMAIDEVQIIFTPDSTFLRDHISKTENKVKIRESGDWHFRGDTLFLQGNRQSVNRFTCRMENDSMVQLSADIDFDGDGMEKEKYSARLKKFR